MENKIPPVPFVFYDIISRLPAGLLICAVLHWWLTGQLIPTAFTSNLADGWALLSILILTLSYVVGLAASAPAYLIYLFMDSFVGLCLCASPDFRDQIIRTGFESKRRSSWTCLPCRLRRIRGKAESIRTKDIEGYRQITKHNAEAALFGNLVGGLALGWIVVELWFMPVSSECIVSPQPDSRSKIVLLVVCLGLLALTARTFFWWTSYLSIRKSRGSSSITPKVR